MVTLMRLLDLTLVTMIGLAFSACATSSSNERYLRSEVAPLAENLLRCPQNQILTQCVDQKCYTAAATGCGRTVQYSVASGQWLPLGAPTPAYTPAWGAPGGSALAAQPQPSDPRNDNTPLGSQPLPPPGYHADAPTPAPAGPATLSKPVAYQPPARAGEGGPPAVSYAPPSAGASSSGPPSATASAIQGSPQPTAYAIVVGIEQYPGLPSAVGARADAKQFARIAHNSLGVPENQIHVALDGEASRGRIERDLAWAAGNVRPGGRLYFYFSGLGSTDTNPQKATPYLLPSDGDPQYLAQTSLALESAFALLHSSKAKEIVFFVDACFSVARENSGGRCVLPPGARPIVAVKAAPTPGNIVLFTAAEPAQVARSTANQGAGLFSWHLLHGLGAGAADLNGDGQITLQELADYVTPRVAREAAKANLVQSPRLKVGDKLVRSGDMVIEWGIATN